MTTLLFQDAGGGGLFGGIAGFLPFILIFAIFYFLVIVPNKRRQRELQQTISALKPGDRIITTGGIVATVAAVKETSLIVRSEKSMFEITRSAVASLQSEEEKKAS